MINNKKVLAIIPARSGSKGLLGKNIMKFCGKPLIAWSIEAACDSKYIDEVMVTTDGEGIAREAREAGARVPFIRPEALATDTATSFDVVKHAIDFYATELHQLFDYVVLLEPTSPLRDAYDIDTAIEQLLSHISASAIVGISLTESQNPAFLVKKDDEGFIQGYGNESMQVLRRQQISPVYFFEGSIYVSQVNTLLSKKTFYHEGTLGYELPKWKSIEIDDMDDFIMAEALMKYKRGGL